MGHSLRRRAAISATPTRSAVTPPASGATDAFSKRDRTEKKKERPLLPCVPQILRTQWYCEKTIQNWAKGKRMRLRVGHQKRRIVELQYIVRIEKKPTPARLNQK